MPSTPTASPRPRRARRAASAPRSAAPTVPATPTTEAIQAVRAAVMAAPRPATPLALSPNALTVLGKRYLIKDAAGAPTETPADLFWRVARVIAAEEARYGYGAAEIIALAEEFYALMVSRRFLPNSPTLMNAGRPLGQLSACFVLPVEDALANGTNGIYDTLTSMALIHQSGGGTGFSFSRLRPKGSMVRSTTGAASGPVSFMKLYDASTDAVKQGGTRRGANMGILRVDHPDIMEFIACKEDLTQATNFNISVAITDRFMTAVEAGTPYDLVDPKTQAVVGRLDAREVFEKVVRNAWNTGEPGVFFVDQANRFNPVPHLGSYEATNPCGEQPLLPYDVCNLGSINLGLYVDVDAPADTPWRQRVRWDALKRDTQLATRFLDLVIDANRFPLPQITDLAQRIRRIGNGVMGFADMLVRLGVGYDSPEGLAVAAEVARVFYAECLNASEARAATHGVFPEWERSIWGPDATCARDAQGHRIRPMRRLRNCNVNTVAPTGTISIIADCASGIEPLFAVAFMRNQAGVMMPDVNKDFVRVAQAEGWYAEALMERIAKEGHIHFPEVPARWQAVFRTAHDVTPEMHVRHQAAWQASVDSAISKTTNFPNAASIDDVRTIYRLAHALGCKGVTVYRDGSRHGQVLSTGATGTAGQTPSAEAQAEQAARAAEVAALQAALAAAQAEATALRAAHGKRERPDELRGVTRRVTSPVGTMYVTLNVDAQGRPFEMFASLGKAGGEANAGAEAVCRLASLALRSGVSILEIHEQLRGIASTMKSGWGPNVVLSIPDAIAQGVEKILQAREGEQQELPLQLGAAAPETVPDAAPVPAAQPTLQFARPEDHDAKFEVCTNCGSAGSMDPGDGCLKCLACGESRCK